MTRHIAPRLPAYAALAAGGLLSGLVLGRVELVALAAPFALAAVLAPALAREPRLRVSLELDRERALETDAVDATISIDSDEAESVDVLLELPPQLAATSPNPRAIAIAAGETRTLELPFRCDRWGAFLLGPVLLRAHDRLGFYAWETRLGGHAPLRVYPSVETLHALLPPLETQVFVGN
ncbi:MAG TPA: hypothetical protein VGG88_10155, partial [Gaiellaceae bacterium]